MTFIMQPVASKVVLNEIKIGSFSLKLLRFQAHTLIEQGQIH